MTHHVASGAGACPPPTQSCSDPSRAAPDLLPLRVAHLGQVPYGEAAALQDHLAAARLRHEVPDTLLLLQHPPVITLGRRATLADHVYLPPEALAARGIDLQRTTRGGLATYHGPGQLVGYPILHLRQRGLRLPDYVAGLEACLVRSLACIGVEARVDPQHVGVWTARGKIAAIGIQQRHGVSLHGFALNLQPDLGHFSLFNPCGLAERGVTSAADILGHHVDLHAFADAFVQVFAAHFGYAPASEGAREPAASGTSLSTIWAEIRLI